MPVEIDDINEQDRREYLRCMRIGKGHEDNGKFAAALLWYFRAIGSAMDKDQDFTARQGCMRCKKEMPKYRGEVP